MRGIRILFGTTALLAGLALAPAAQAQIVVNIGVQPSCAYGYYGYSPYACAPYGYYGPGYFYNGIFLGMGPWGGWGYSHGWGNHRFVSEGGGNYHGGPGRMSYRDDQGRGGGQFRGNAEGSRGGGARPSAGRPEDRGNSRGSAPRASDSHNNGGGSRGGGGHEGGGGGSRGGGERH
jgi:hypothetical protein